MNRPERFHPPSVDEVLRSPHCELAIARHGRQAATGAVRQVLERLRRDQGVAAVPLESIAERALASLEERERPSRSLLSAR